MIFVIEIPHQRPASSWTAHDEQDFCHRLAQTHIESRSGATIWEKITLEELCDSLDATVDELRGILPDNAPDLPPNTTLWRADYYRSGDDRYLVDEVSQRDAFEAYAKDDLQSCRIYWTDAEALEAFEAGHDEAHLGRMLREAGVLQEADKDEDED